MSDKNVKGQEAENQRQVPSATRGRPGPVHEALYSQIMADVKAMVEEYAPTTGTVTGMDGGKVLVQVDEESTPREVGIPREKGRKYEKGDRVRLQRSRGSGKDQYTALGQVSTKAGKDPAVGSDEIYDNSVDQGHLRNKSVGRDQLQGGSVGQSEVEDNSLPLGKLNQNAQKTINDKADGNHKHNISDINGANFAPNNHTHKADDISGLNFASNNHSHSGYASKTHGHSIDDISGLRKELNSLEQKIKNRGGDG